MPEYPSWSVRAPGLDWVSLVADIDRAWVKGEDATTTGFSASQDLLMGKGDSGM